MAIKMNDKLSLILDYFDNETAIKINSIDLNIKNNIQEIRLRTGKPIMIKLNGKTEKLDKFLSKSCGECIFTKEKINLIFSKMCDYSFHIKQIDLARGFVTLKGGNRAGISGTFISENNKISSIKEVSSIVIRIANEKFGCSDEIIEKIFNKRICGVLIAGPPTSGKTTVLRDLAFRLSNNYENENYNVAIIDERGEIAGTYMQTDQNRTGISCDVLNGCSKTEGMEIALRCLAPDIIICDEIGTREDSKAICDNVNGGVITIATAHGRDLCGLMQRKNILEIIKTGAFEKIVFLKNSIEKGPGQIDKIYDKEDIDFHMKGMS